MRSILKRIARRVLRRQPAGQPAVPPLTQTDPTFPARKARKLARLAELLRTDLPHRLSERGYDFLTDELRQQFNITDTDNVSSNQYDPTALAMIETYRDGWILDCGAGSRRVYYDNVVNFEICDYDSTDVRGVGERLPFRDGVFDAAFSFAVLEHVKDPFACAREIARTLKPGGVLYCVVPFLQPLHGYPNHYFNMSHQGLRTLFEPSLDRREARGHPQRAPDLDAGLDHRALGASPAAARAPTLPEHATERVARRPGRAVAARLRGGPAGRGPVRAGLDDGAVCPQGCRLAPPADTISSKRVGTRAGATD
jgi:SAM-dependent methyltransferase